MGCTSSHGNPKGREGLPIKFSAANPDTVIGAKESKKGFTIAVSSTDPEALEPLAVSTDSVATETLPSDMPLSRNSVKFAGDKDPMTPLPKRLTVTSSMTIPSPVKTPSTLTEPMSVGSIQSSGTLEESSVAVDEIRRRDKEAFSEIGSPLKCKLMFDEDSNQIETDKITGSVGFMKAASPPKSRDGSLKKLGQIFKTWRTRYFILHEGLLSYYEEDPKCEGNYAVFTPEAHIQSCENGRIGVWTLLAGYRMIRLEKKQIQLIPPNPPQAEEILKTYFRCHNENSDSELKLQLQDYNCIVNDREYLLQAHSRKDYIDWAEALQSHIDYFEAIK